MSRRRTILLLAIASQAAFSLITFGLPAIGSDIRQTLHLSPFGFGAVFAAVGLGSAVALIPAGMLVDRFGARRVLVAGGIVNATGVCAAGLTDTGTAFGLALFAGGVGGSAVPVAGMTALLREFPPQERGVALGWRQLAVPLGGTLGSVLLPAMVALGGVRAAMIGAGLAGGATAIGFALVAGRDRAETHHRGLGGVLGIPRMRPLLLLGMLYVWALGGVLAYYIPAVVSGGLSHREAAIGFTILNVTAAGSRVVWGRLADRGAGTHRLLTLRNTGLVACTAAVAMPLALAAGAWAALPATAVLAFGVFGFNGVLYLVAGEIAGPDRAGRAVGVASTVVFGWGALAAPICGEAVLTVGYTAAVWGIAAATTAAGTLVALRLLRSTAGPAGPILESWKVQSGEAPSS